MAGIVVLDMNNTASTNLARILSNKFPVLNPTEDCYCYEIANRGDQDGVINYGLGWWMGQAETKQDEVNSLKAEVERLTKAGDKIARNLMHMAGEHPKALADEWQDAKRGVEA